MAATNNSLSLAETATVPAPQQALSSTFEVNVLTRMLIRRASTTLGPRSSGELWSNPAWAPAT